MKYEEIDDSIRKFIEIFHDQLDRCSFRCIVDGRVYCLKKDKFIRLNNNCLDCPELPEPMR